MILKGLALERIFEMSDQEIRWLDNTKKAFEMSDKAFQSGAPENECIEAMCRSIDTAKTLHRSLQGLEVSNRNHRKKFIEFLHMEIPYPNKGGVSLNLIHARTREPLSYGFGELVYEIRCMVHENENLNSEENVVYHVLLDWAPPKNRMFVVVEDGRAIVNAPLLWERVRQVLATMITYIDSARAFPETKNFSVSIDPPLGSIGPSKIYVS
jgi:hypothetical protein